MRKKSFVALFLLLTAITVCCLYAACGAKTADTYCVRFEESEGSEVADIEGINKNSTVKLPPVPTRTGYGFGGWFIDDKTFEIRFT